MDDWFLKDTQGNIVGPLSREVAVALLRSRPGTFLFSSTDKVQWLPVRAPTVQSLVTAEDPRARLKRELQEAQKAELELDRYRELKPHELFGVPRGSSARDFRKGFLTLAKRYHPGRLPRDVSPALLRANMAVYQYLTEVLTEVEKAPVVVEALVPTRPSSPRPSAPRVEVLPAWQLEALKLQREQDRLRGELAVTRQTAFIFSAHRLMNLSNEAAFYPCTPSLALGTRLNMTFHFEEASRSVATLGTVAYESVLPGSGPRGFGVRMQLSPQDKGFMLRESQRLQAGR